MEHIDVRIEWSGRHIFGEESIRHAMIQQYGLDFTVSKLPPPAFKKTCDNCGYDWESISPGKRKCYGKTSLDCGMWTPAPDKCEHDWYFCGVGGGQESINNDYICKKCGAVKKEVVQIKPAPDKCELKLPEKLNEYNVRNSVNGQDAIVVAVNSLIDYLSQKGR